MELLTFDRTAKRGPLWFLFAEWISIQLRHRCSSMHFRMR
jgi:hypothetical protein